MDESVVVLIVTRQYDYSTWLLPQSVWTTSGDLLLEYTILAFLMTEKDISRSETHLLLFSYGKLKKSPTQWYTHKDTSKMSLDELKLVSHSFIE